MKLYNPIEFEKFVKETLSKEEYSRYKKLRAKHMRLVTKQAVDAAKPIAYDAYAIGQGVAKIGLMLASGGKYKPNSWYIKMSYDNAHRKAEDLRRDMNSTLQPSLSQKKTITDIDKLLKENQDFFDKVEFEKLHKRLVSIYLFRRKANKR